ncbi:sugar translocase [Clostridium sp. TW13]|uniref:Sugar translocase n=1 Tax=Inconstantimicrobium mannanitabidum TaxID=1604901 RepID=A0ACB5RF51_9CLOT|nr:GtrA family protein [Clostridium sp. TW13]GKX67781.1 sugar translocase [Clostridium sp. TW13]
MLEVIKFGLVGILNTGITMVVYNILIFFGVNYIVANAIGYVAGVANSYIWNKNWVFNAKDKKDNSLIFKFIVVNVISFAVNSGVLILCENYITKNKTIAQLPAIIMGMAVNYILNKIWTFKK